MGVGAPERPSIRQSCPSARPLRAGRVESLRSSLTLKKRKRKTGARLQLVTFALTLLAGCVSSGWTGATTEADVVKALGPPTRTTTTSEGLRVISYVGAHAQAKASSFIPIVGAGGATAQGSAVTFRFGPDHKLLGYSTTQSNVDMNTGIASASATTAAATRESPPAALPTSTALAQAPPAALPTSTALAQAPPAALPTSTAPAQAPPAALPTSTALAQAPPAALPTSTALAQAPPAALPTSTAPAQAPPAALPTSTAPAQAPPAALPTSTALAQAPPASPTLHHAHKQAVGATFGSDPDGLRVVSVEKYGPAARAGLTVGDLITHIDGKPTAPVYWEYAAQNITNAKGTVTLRIAGRGDRTLSLSMGGARTAGTTNPAPNDSAPPQAGATTGASHVRLGVHCMHVTPEIAQTDHLPVDIGVRVVTVEAGSVAEAGGIQVGDVLLKYGDRSLNEISDLTAAIAATTKGAYVPITLWRRTGESVVAVQF